MPFRRTILNAVRRGVFAAVLLLLFAACTPSGPAFPPTIEITSAREIGQTFHTDWDGLNAIVVYAAPNGPVPDALRVSLYEDLDDRRPLWAGRVPLPPDLAPGWLRIPFATQPDSANRSFFITFEVDGEAQLALSTGPGGFYLDGALHRDREPLDRQLDFHLRHQPIRLALGVAGDAIPAAGVLAGFAWLFTLPGWALFSGFWGAWERQGLLSKTVLATGAGMALYPILLLPPWLVGLDIGPWLAWTVPFAAAGSFAWRYRRKTWAPAFRIPHPALGDILTGIALLAVLASRLLPLEVLDTGMGGDSYHHTLIARLLVERGGLFSSWEPYAPVVTFTYHYGFHTAAAVVSWVLGLDPARSVLWTGQVVNFLAVAALAPLMQALFRQEKDLLPTENENSGDGLRRWLPGLAALVAAGLVFPMPAYYTNWGRYTQIAGQFLLAAWMVVALDLFRSGRRSWRQEIPGWVLLAGLGLTHYRVLIFAGLFVLAYWLVNVRREGLLQAAVSVFRAGAGAAVLFLPWFWNVFGGELMAILQIQLTTPAADASPGAAVITGIDPDLTRYLPLPIWGLLPVILIWGLARRDRIAGVFGLWSLFLFLVANPGLLGLPGEGAINNFAVLIAAYLPAAVLLGSGLVSVAELLRERAPGGDSRFGSGTGTQIVSGTAPWGSSNRGLQMRPVHSRWFRWAVTAGFLAGCLWGAAAQAALIRPHSNALVTRPDLAAFNWVRDHVPEDAVFLVNLITTSSEQAVAGTDAGWWVPYFTRRDTVLPPFIFISEKTKSPDLRLDLLDLSGALAAAGPADPAVLERLKAFGVTHLYLGQRQGIVNSQGERIEIAPLLADDHFELIYHVDRVWIFAVHP